MKKLSVEEEVKRGLITAKYQYPCTVTSYKNGVPTSSRVVTHSILATQDLQDMHPSLKKEINRVTEAKPKKPQTVRQMINMLGKEEGQYFRK